MFDIFCIMMDLQVIQQLQQTIGSEQLKNFFEMVYVGQLIKSECVYVGKK